MPTIHHLHTQSPPQPNETTIHKSKALANFTIVPNTIAQSETLSPVARGVLLYLISLPARWEIRVDTTQAKTGLGRDKLRRVFAELAAAGYMHRFAIPGKTTDTFSGSRWHIFTDPADLAEKLAEPSNPMGFIGDRLKTRRSGKSGDVHKETLPDTKAHKATARPIPPPPELAAFLKTHGLSKRLAKIYFAMDADFQAFPANTDGSAPPPRDWRTGLLSFAKSHAAA